MYLDARSWLSNNNVISFEAGKNEFSRARFSIVSSVHYCTSIAPLKTLNVPPSDTATIPSTAPSINKLLNQETTNSETIISPDLIRHSHWPKDEKEVELYFVSKNSTLKDLGIEFFRKYESQNWMVNGSAITKWRYQADRWIADPDKFKDKIVENTSTRRKSVEPVNPYDQFR